MANQFNRLVGCVLVTAACAAAVPARADEESPVRPTLAIVDFDVTPAGSTLPPPHLGTTAAQLVLDRLVSASEFHMLDGRWLQPGDRTLDPRTAAQALRINAREAGVDYLVLGSITRFSAENRQRSAGGGGFGLPALGGYRRQTNELVVSLWASIVDVATGEVVATTTGTGNGTRRKVALGAVGLLPFGVGGLTSGSSASRDAQLDEAIRQATSSAASGLLNAAPRLVRSNGAQRR
jgi:curli biogenesis system outer membrane secretion channel CsgG